MIRRSKRAILAVAFVAAGLGLMPEQVLAENAEPEKCTCDIVPDANYNNGARVLNATACWSNEVRGRQWCDITVQDLEGGADARSAIVATLFSHDSGDDPANLVNALRDEFERFISTYQEAPRGTLALDVNQARDIVPDLMKQNEKALAECVVAFEEATLGKGGLQGKSTGDFRCRVGQSSGWLRIEFRIGDVWLAYMLAPNA